MNSKNTVTRDFSNHAMRNRVLGKWQKKGPPFIRGALVLVFLAAVLWFWSTRSRTSSTDSSKRSGKTATSAARETPRTKTVHDTIRPGDSYYSLMHKHGIDQNQAREFYRAFESLRLPSFVPGNQYRIVTSLAGNLEGFFLRNARRVHYCVAKRKDSLQAYIRHPDFRIEKKAILGQLKNDLYSSILGDGEKPELVVRFADIFAWDVNFFTDPRPGDSFGLVVEKLYDNQEFVKYGRILASFYGGTSKTFWAFLFKDSLGNAGYYDRMGHPVEKMFLKAPLNFTRISSGFSLRRFHPILHIYRKHPAVDYAAPPGTPVFAAADGRIQYAKWAGGYGKCICIKHSGGYRTYYGHLSRFASGIAGNKTVRQKQCIGYVGSTGLSSGPHLDYRVELHGRYINPLKIKSPVGKSVPLKRLGEFERIKRIRTTMLRQDSAIHPSSQNGA